MWYVLQTMSGEEQECLADCRAKLAPGTYRTMFVPQFIGQKHWGKAWHDVKKPLFAGYLFIDAEAGQIDEIYDSLKKVDRLTKLLKDADRIAPVTAKEQEFLQGMMDEEHVVHYSLGFMIGERVCITEGPLRKLEGNIRKVDRHRRVAMLDVDVFGRKTPIEVGFGAVKRVSEEEFEQIRQRNIAKYRGDMTARDDGSVAGNRWNRSHGRNPIQDRGKVDIRYKENDDIRYRGVNDIRRKKDKNQDEAGGRYRGIRIPSGMVFVTSGVFEGMMGKFLSVDTGRNEWTVEMEIFDKPTRVTFQRDEILM